MKTGLNGEHVAKSEWTDERFDPGRSSRSGRLSLHNPPVLGSSPSRTTGHSPTGHRSTSEVASRFSGLRRRSWLTRGSWSATRAAPWPSAPKQRRLPLPHGGRHGRPRIPRPGQARRPSGVRTAPHRHRRPHFGGYLVLCIAVVFSLDEQAVHLLQSRRPGRSSGSREEHGHLAPKGPRGRTADASKGLAGMPAVRHRQAGLRPKPCVHSLGTPPGWPDSDQPVDAGHGQAKEVD